MRLEIYCSFVAAVAIFWLFLDLSTANAYRYLTGATLMLVLPWLAERPWRRA
jgi:hypothetical protein